MVHEFFTYGNDSASRGAVVCAAIPANIATKQELFTTLATQLSFPDYFGENWDAFHECVRDLSWLPAGPVVLIHADVPLVNDVPNARAYVAILDSTVRKMSKSKGHPLSIVFPIRFRAQIEWLLRSQQGQDVKRFT
jgi:hypothetical protein